MHNEDRKLARKRFARFSCAVLGAAVAFFALLGAAVLCGNQLTSISALVLTVAPGESKRSVTNSLAPVSYAALLGDSVVPLEAPRLSLEDTSTFDLVCEGDRLEWRAGNLRQQPYQLGNYFRLRNDCDRDLSVKICWFKSIFALAFAPACTL